MAKSAQGLLLPRARPDCVPDFATRVPIIANQRHAARRVRRVRRSLRIVGRVLGVGLALASVAVVTVVLRHWLRTTPLLAVRTVDVQGVQRLSEETVRAAAAIEPGTSIFALDVGIIERQLGSLPGVRRARVVRHLPDRVTVMLEEREPYALTNVSGRGRADRLVWIDADGYFVATEPRAIPSPWPILSGVDVAAPGVALGVDGPASDRLQVGLALLRAVQRTGGRVAGRISEIDLAMPDEPVLYLVDGAEVRLGAEAWDERLARLDGVLGELDHRAERVLSVDLRFRDQVVLTPQPTPSTGPEARAGAPGARRRAPAASGVNPPELR